MDEIALQHDPMAANQPQNPPLVAAADPSRRYNPYTPEMTATIEAIMEANGGPFCGPVTVFRLLPANSGYTFMHVKNAVRRLLIMKTNQEDDEAQAQAQAQDEAGAAGAPA